MFLLCSFFWWSKVYLDYRNCGLFIRIYRLNVKFASVIHVFKAYLITRIGLFSVIWVTYLVLCRFDL